MVNTWWRADGEVAVVMQQRQPVQFRTAVVTNSKGMTLYWFAPDTSTTSSAPDRARPTGRRCPAR